MNNQMELYKFMQQLLCSVIKLFNFLHDHYTAANDDSSVCIAENE